MAPGVYMDGDGVAELTNTTVTVGFDRDAQAIGWAYVTNDGMDGVSEETKANTAEGLVLTGNAVVTVNGSAAEALLAGTYENVVITAS